MSQTTTQGGNEGGCSWIEIVIARGVRANKNQQNQSLEDKKEKERVNKHYRRVEGRAFTLRRRVVGEEYMGEGI